MRNQFEKFLINQGYKQYTDSGHPSTVYSYLNKLEKVLIWENMTWEDLAYNISSICKLYDKGGVNEKKGAKSNRTVINALKQFELFVEHK